MQLGPRPGDVSTTYEPATVYDNRTGTEASRH